MKKKFICILEDDLSFGAYLYTRLSDLGCHIKLLETFDQGEAYLDEHMEDIDIAIIQTQLKGGNGTDVAHYIRELKPEMGLIMLTGQEDTQELCRLLKLPKEHIFQMPFFPIRVLRELVESLILRR